MTAAEITPLPEAVFARPAPAREYADQRWLVEAMKTLREAVDRFHDGDLQGFLLGLKRAAFLVGINPEWRTPSTSRVMGAINRVAMDAADRMRIVKSRGGRT